MAEDLGIASADIRRFLEEAKRALNCARLKTNFGKSASTHWYYIVLADDGIQMPFIVTLEVRRAAGVERVYLDEVRPPTAEELAEIGAQAETDRPYSKRAVRALVRKALSEAKNALTSIGLIDRVVRGTLAYQGAVLDGEYTLGPWRISPAPESLGTSLIGEKIILCDRVQSGRDGFDISSRLHGDLQRLALLQTVFWMVHIHSIPSEHRWTIEPHELEGELKLENKLLQLGYAGQPPLADAERLRLPATGGSRSLDRLNTFDWGVIAGETFKPPDDAPMLFETFDKADLKTAQRFLAASKAYHTSSVVASATTTGAIAYLVVAAESLIEDTLAVCGTCHQSRGILAATRELFFRELSCLRQDEAKVKGLLGRAYEIRSQHFHDAQFLAGELTDWHPVDILMPDSIDLRDVHRQMMALVNGLLVAWLVRRVTGTAWSRASGAFPDWREHKHFSISVQLGGPG